MSITSSGRDGRSLRAATWRLAFRACSERARRTQLPERVTAGDRCGTSRTEELPVTLLTARWSRLGHGQGSMQAAYILADKSGLLRPRRWCRRAGRDSAVASYQRPRPSAGG